MFEEMKEELRDILDVPERRSLAAGACKNRGLFSSHWRRFSGDLCIVRHPPLRGRTSANMQDFCPAFFIFHFDIHISF